MTTSVEYRPTTDSSNKAEDSAFRTGCAGERRVLARGRGASAGRARGRALVVSRDGPSRQPVAGEILVCGAITPDLLPQLAYASAVITDRGGVLSRGATHCRELGIPCIVAATGATNVIADGRLIEVDATSGEVRALLAD